MKNLLGKYERGKTSSFASKSIRVIGFVAGAVFSILVAGVLLLKLSPETSAYGADALRSVIGDQPVAMMEMALFQVQDSIQNIEYRLGLAKPTNPFGSGSPSTTGAFYGNAGSAKPFTALAQHSTATPGAAQVQSGSPRSTATAIQKGSPQPLPQGQADKMVPVTGANAAGWTLPVIVGQSGKYGNGEWQPYLKDSSGRVLAYRTFVQPDPTRPYTYAAIVAFDLQHTHLHYVIGTEEPYPKGAQKTTSGMIPETDMVPGMLLAAFNGGFKYEHGQSGSMADGLVSAPPQNGYGTLAIYRNGTIRIGEWGKDIQPSPDMVAYRQNGPLLIQDGSISPLVDQSRRWGLTLAGKTVTFRSAIAISPDERTLYYFAGQYIAAPTLAAAMMAVHPKAGIQLDINDYWVYFTSFTDKDNQIVADPLLPKAMIGSSDRFLRPYSRDFFYVTTAP